MICAIGIKIRVSANEKAAFLEKCADTGMSQAELIRLSLTKPRTFTAPNLALERERIREIRRVGQNINQIARKINSHASGVDRVELLAHLVSFEKVLSSLKTRL